jgi:hypothetical protein
MRSGPSPVPARRERRPKGRARSGVAGCKGADSSCCLRGSIYGVGRRFQSFGINDLEMVAQICPRWNRLEPWFELVGAFKEDAA